MYAGRYSEKLSPWDFFPEGGFCHHLARGWGSPPHNLRPASLSCHLIQDQPLLGSQQGCDSRLMGSPWGSRNGIVLADSVSFFGEWRLDLIVPSLPVQMSLTKLLPSGQAEWPGFRINPGEKPFRRFHQNAPQIHLGLEEPWYLPAGRHVSVPPLAARSRLCWQHRGTDFPVNFLEHQFTGCINLADGN